MKLDVQHTEASRKLQVGQTFIPRDQTMAWAPSSKAKENQTLQGPEAEEMEEGKGGPDTVPRAHGSSSGFCTELWPSC